jgi:hypothetical protein
MHPMRPMRTPASSRPAPGENDVTVIFKAVAGAKRWQPLARPADGGGAAAVEANYTVILGSHRNSCLKFEKNGETMEVVGAWAGAAAAGTAGAPSWRPRCSVAGRCLRAPPEGSPAACTCPTRPRPPSPPPLSTTPPSEPRGQVQGVPGAHVAAHEFTAYWVNCDSGAITVGSGAPGEGVAHRWVDPAPGDLARVRQGGTSRGGRGWAAHAMHAGLGRAAHPSSRHSWKVGPAASGFMSCARAGLPVCPPARLLQGVHHAGLSCWDRHVSYRNVRVLPPLDPERLAAAAAAAAERRRAEGGAAGAADAAAAGSPEAQRKASGALAAGAGAATDAGEAAPAAPPPPPSCFQLASRAVARSLSPRCACRALQVAELLLPAAEGVYSDTVGYIARRFEQARGGGARGGKRETSARCCAAARTLHAASVSVAVSVQSGRLPSP